MSILKNSIWNVGGVIIPTLIAIPAMGVLARTLGVEAFGIFTIAYALIGYASIFDAGLSRAVVREVAIYRNSTEEICQTIGTSVVAVLVLSMFSSVLIFYSAFYLIDFLNVSPGLHDEVVHSFQLLALCIPTFLLVQVWLAYFEGAELFAELNVLKTIINSIVAISPLLCFFYGGGLHGAILGLIAGRFVSAIIVYSVTAYYLPSGRKKYSRLVLNRLVSFGGWITASNIISPIMVYFDRFVLSNLTGAQNVAYYTAPSDVVSRLLIIPGAIVKALFPRISKETSLFEYKKSLRHSYFAMLFACLCIVLPFFIFADKVLYYWMGWSDVADSVLVFRMLLIGFVFNALAHIPFTQIQARGHAKVTAIIHMFEVLPYLAMLYALVSSYGLVGAAFAWVIRVFFDCLLLNLFVRQFR
ncbi:flippase [Chitinibacter sp. SCUT-21]|uniref:flippase n=1 Tax=Chitinibacter sp. SCUT-21 TaxID=2970891 RepID=UPI0035A73289